jgi:hypothetical protein
MHVYVRVVNTSRWNARTSGWSLRPVTGSRRSRPARKCRCRRSAADGGRARPARPHRCDRRSRRRTSSSWRSATSRSTGSAATPGTSGSPATARSALPAAGHNRLPGPGIARSRPGRNTAGAQPRHPPPPVTAGTVLSDFSPSQRGPDGDCALIRVLRTRQPSRPETAVTEPPGPALQRVRRRRVPAPRR